MNAPATPGPARLARLLRFLKTDPDNLSLLAAAADAAVDEGDPQIAIGLLDRCSAIAPLTPELENLRGLALIGAQDFPGAATVFEGLLASGADAPALRFSLAWCKAMLGDHADALTLLDDATLAASPAARGLKIEQLHHLGQLEDALACGLGLAELYPEDTALMGALANAAMDAEDLALTRHYAERAGDNSEGQAALGMVMLDEERIAESFQFFERALQARPDNARAMLGKGLGLLAEGDYASASGWLDRGAKGFDSHIGSWVAAGWAHLVAGDNAAARERFERALALDDNFAESHGALAVIDITAGDMESARRRAEVALRLDRKCFSAALAKSLLAASDGDHATAERIRQIAMNVPVGPSGKTIAQAIARMGANRRGGSR